MSQSIAFTLNRQAVRVEASPAARLAHVLRDQLGLTGTKIGCDAGDCGACSVLLDGRQVCGCLVAVAQVEGRTVTTVEGLADGDKLHPMQAAFREHHGLQCGFCTPGMIMTGVALGQGNAAPSEAEVRHALEGNLCRCTGYQNIVEAIMSGARAMHTARS